MWLMRGTPTCSSSMSATVARVTDVFEWACHHHLNSCTCYNLFRMWFSGLGLDISTHGLAFFVQTQSGGHIVHHTSPALHTLLFIAVQIRRLTSQCRYDLLKQVTTCISASHCVLMALVRQCFWRAARINLANNRSWQFTLDACGALI